MGNRASEGGCDKPPKLSIIVPAYNVEGFYLGCIEGLAAQARPDIEFVFVDDGSFDRTASLLDEFAAAEPRATVVRRLHAGVSAARNAGLDIARGDYVSFVDADDCVEPGYADRIIDAMDGAGADIAVFSARPEPSVGWVEETLSVRPGMVDGDGCGAILDWRGSIPFLWNKAYRRELLEAHRVRFVEGMAIGEDTCFQFLAFPPAQRIVFIDDKLYRYRTTRTGSAMSVNAVDPLAMQLSNVRVFSFAMDALDDAGYLRGHAPRALAALQFLLYDAAQLVYPGCYEFGRAFETAFGKRFSPNDLGDIPPEQASLYQLFLDWGSSSPATRRAASVLFRMRGKSQRR